MLNVCKHVWVVVNVPRLFVLIVMSFSIVGCTQGRWVKSDAALEQTQQDFAECESMNALQPQPVTLGQKRGANPDLSSLKMQKCMRNKGYQWVTGDAKPPKKDVLEIVPGLDTAHP
jgi:hypothetical protein